jgi:hypothetical protein
VPGACAEWAGRYRNKFNAFLKRRVSIGASGISDSVTSRKSIDVLCGLKSQKIRTQFGKQSIGHCQSMDLSESKCQSRRQCSGGRIGVREQIAGSDFTCGSRSKEWHTSGWEAFPLQCRRVVPTMYLQNGRHCGSLLFVRPLAERWYRRVLKLGSVS